MYKLTNTSTVIRIADGAFIPADSNNTDYQEVLAWLAEGNTPEPIDAPTPLTPLQKIASIESAKPITHRMLRDLTMAVGQIAAAVTGRDLEENPAIRDILALEADIAPLRAQAKAMGLIP